MKKPRVLATLTGLFVATGLSVVVVPMHAPAARADAAGLGGDYVALPASVRVLDTRNGTGAPAGKLTMGGEKAFQVAGAGGLPAAGSIRAVLLDVATVGNNTSTHLDMWPDGQSEPTVSMVSAAVNQTISNSAVVGLGQDGKIRVSNASGSTDVVVDVHGYFTAFPASGGAGFVSLTPTRVVDTRHGVGVPQATIPKGGSITVSLVGGAVPPTASAVFLDVLVPGTAGGGFVSAFPAGGSDGLSIFDFVAGDTASGAVVKLGPTGGATFVNHGGAPINLVLDEEGYFTADSTTGAGLRVRQARLLDTRTTGTPVAANGTVDVAVGGAQGLPTRGIEGAILNVTTVGSATAQGFLRAWSVGDPEPTTTSIGNYPIGVDRSDNVVVKPGVDGKIRIRNVSNAAVHLVVDVQGWFADPLPSVQLQDHTPISVLQASPASGQSVGTIDYAYVDNSGNLFYGSQDPGALGTVDWTMISDPSQEFGFTGQPSLAEQPDRRLQVVGQTTDSNISVNTETAPPPPATWGPWVGVGGSMASHPAIARQSDGTLAVFAVDADGQLWVLPQNASGSYTAWQPLGDVDLVGAPTVVAVGTHIQVFALNSAGALQTASYSAGALSPWTDLGGAVTGSPAVVVSQTGQRIRVFVRAADGSVQTKIQDVLHAWPATWDTVGIFTATGSPSAVIDPVTDRTEVVALGDNNSIWRDDETASGSGTWNIWTEESGTEGKAFTDPTAFVFTNSNGPGWAFVTRDNLDTATVITEQGGAATPSTTFTLQLPDN